MEKGSESEIQKGEEKEEQEIYYSIEELFEIKNTHSKQPQLYKERIKASKGITEILRAGAEGIQKTHMKGQRKLQQSMDSAFIPSKTLMTAGINAEDKVKRVIMMNLNIISKLNYRNTKSEIIANWNEHPDIVLETFKHKLIAPTQEPEKPGNGIDLLAKLINDLSEIYEEFSYRIRVIIDESFDSLIGVNREIDSFINLIVYISYLFRCNFIKRVSYGNFLKEIIDNKEYSLKQISDILIVALKVSGGYIDQSKYLEFAYFYRFLSRIQPELDSFSRFQYKTLLEQRETGFKEQKQSAVPVSTGAFKDPCSVILEDMFEEFESEQQHYVMNPQIPYSHNEIMESCILNAGKHAMNLPVYEDFVLNLLLVVYFNNPKGLLKDLKKNIETFVKVVDENDNYKLWDLLGMIIVDLMSPEINFLDKTNALDFVSNDLIPDRDSFTMKLNIVDSIDELRMYETDKLIQQYGGIPPIDLVNDQVAKLVVFDKMNVMGRQSNSDILIQDIKTQLFQMTNLGEPYTAFNFIKNMVLFVIQRNPQQWQQDLQQFERHINIIRNKFHKQTAYVIQMTVDHAPVLKTAKLQFIDQLKSMFPTILESNQSKRF